MCVLRISFLVKNVSLFLRSTYSEMSRPTFWKHGAMTSPAQINPRYPSQCKVCPGICRPLQKPMKELYRPTRVFCVSTWSGGHTSTDSWVSLQLSRLFMHGAEFWSVPNAAHVGSTDRNWYCLLICLGNPYQGILEKSSGGQAFSRPSTMVDQEKTLAVNFSYQGRLVQTSIQCHGSF